VKGFDNIVATDAVPVGAPPARVASGVKTWYAVASYAPRRYKIIRSIATYV